MENKNIEHDGVYGNYVSKLYKSTGVKSQKMWHIAARSNAKPKVVTVRKMY